MDLSKLTFSFQCLNCKFMNKMQIRDVQLMKTVLCCGCHCEIKLVDKNKTVKRKIQESQNMLNVLFENINTKSIKLTL